MVRPYRLRTFFVRSMVALVLALSIVPYTTPVTQAALNLPPGFSAQTYIDGLLSPRAFVFTPDGRVLIAEQGSATSNDINVASIRVFKNGVLLATRAITLNVCGGGERGFLGLALDPNFASNGYVYVYYTRQAFSGAACGFNRGADGPRNRISRITLAGDVAVAGSERVLVDNIPSDSGIHNAGDLHFGPDGYLYASTGDGGSPPSPSADVSSLGGKLLRISPTAGEAGGISIPADNPFRTSANARRCGATPAPGGSGPCQEIFAYGLRNPFRFTMQPGTGIPFVFDVGGGYYEEINRIVNGGWYGYPTCEGPCNASGAINPAFAYSHTNPPSTGDDAAIIGGAFYTGTSYPAEYRDTLFFADFVQGWARRLIYDAGSNSWSSQPFATGLIAPIGMRIGPDGDLYILELPGDNGGMIRRISYQGSGNRAPTAVISASPTFGPLDTVYTFSATGSSDPDGNSLSYAWDFGDGTTQTTSVPTVAKTYTSPGTRTVRLVVTDNGSPSLSSAPVTIQVFPGNSPPGAEIVLTNLSDGSRTSGYYAGDTWAFAAINVTDDQPLPADPFRWTITFQHRDHFHPFLSEVQSQSGQFSIPTSGEPDYVVWYRVRLDVTDAAGQTTTIISDLLPITTTITLQSQPAGGQIILDSETVTAPYSAFRVVGINSSLNVPSPQQIGSELFICTGWADGQPAIRALTVPPGGGSFTALFAPAPPTATSTPAPTPLPFVNLLRNGDFESGNLNDWYLAASGISVEGGAAYEGGYGARMALSGRIDQQFDTVIGRTYYVAGRIRIDSQPANPSWGGLRLHVLNANWAQLGSSQLMNAANTPLGQWRPINFSFVANSSVSRMSFDNFSGGGQFNAAIDSLIVSDTPLSDGPAATATASSTATSTATATASSTPTPTATSSSTATRTATAINTATSTPTRTATATASSTPTTTPTRTPTRTPTATGIPTGDNLLTNGGFENGNTSGWESITQVSAQNSAAYSGTYGAKHLSKGRIDQRFTTVAGRTYYISAYIRIDRQISAPTWGGMRIRVANDTWAILASSPNLTPSNSPIGSWTRVSFSFVANTATTRIVFENFSNGTFDASADAFIVSSSPIP